MRGKSYAIHQRHNICVQIRQYLSLVSDTEVEKYWKKKKELIFKAYTKKVLFLKTFSCLVVLATSSVQIGLLKQQSIPRLELITVLFSSELRFAHRQMTACILGRRRRRCSCAVKRNARSRSSGSWWSTAKADSPHIRTYGFPVIYSCFNLYFLREINGKMYTDVWC